MKRTVFLFWAAFFLIGNVLPVMAQTTGDPFVPIAVYVPNIGKYASVHAILESRLNVVASRYGMTGGSYNPRFVMYPEITVLDEQRTAAPPVLTLVQLQVNVYIADYVDNKRFASASFIVKGGGQSEEKAYMDAVKKINDNAELQRLVSEGKRRIADYYNTMCDKIIIEANSLAAENQFVEALSLLSGAPQASTCFESSRYALVKIYQKYMDYDCGRLLQLAKASYASRNIEEALLYISDINPNSVCYNEAQGLYQDLLNYVVDVETQRHQEKIEERNRQHEIQQQQIEHRHELEVLKLGLAYSTYQHEQRVEQQKADRAYEIARILAKNTISFSDGSTVENYVNSLINPNW